MHTCILLLFAEQGPQPGLGKAFFYEVQMQSQSPLFQRCLGIWCQGARAGMWMLGQCAERGFRTVVELYTCPDSCQMTSDCENCGFGLTVY